MTRHFLYGFMALILAALPMPCLGQDAVMLRPVRSVEHDAIRLSDVFEGVPEGQDADIAVSPAPGKSVTYNARIVTGVAKRHNLAWQAQSQADQIVLTRAATHITPDMIQKVVLAKIQEEVRLPSDSPEVVFDNKHMDILLPSEQAPDFSLVNFSYDQTSHRFHAALSLPTMPQAPSQTISGHLVIKKSVPVLAHRLTAGTMIGAHDLDWITVPEEQINNDVLAQADAIVGQELRRDQAEGDFIRTRDVTPPRLVTRGSLVTLKIETPLMLITTQGRALQDGARNDVVRVRNNQSNRIVEGLVEADGVIRVMLLQKVAVLDAAKEE
ncbi:MAG: flagellar basal body P-ring formation chaperone FlgA [Bdellovibrionales bacterium]|jgi:flagella basal body P-ring formation protein FlgA